MAKDLGVLPKSQFYVCRMPQRGFLHLEPCFPRKGCASPAAVRLTIEKKMLVFLVAGQGLGWVGVGSCIAKIVWWSRGKDSSVVKSGKPWRLRRREPVDSVYALYLKKLREKDPLFPP